MFLQLCTQSSCSRHSKRWWRSSGSMDCLTTSSVAGGIVAVETFVVGIVNAGGACPSTRLLPLVDMLVSYRTGAQLKAVEKCPISKKVAGVIGDASTARLIAEINPGISAEDPTVPDQMVDEDVRLRVQPLSL